jgi:hypothetical protein
MTLGHLRGAFLTVAFTFLGAANLVGCRPGVTWLPDGSGLLYTEKDGSRLVTYSITKKARRVVAADTGTNTLLPAVSPDGKYFAVGRAVANKNNPPSVQIFLFTADGAISKKTSVYAVGKSDPQLQAGQLLNVVLAWGRQNTLLGCLGEVEATFVLDLDRDRIIELPGSRPFPVDAWSPVRPDRKGFLSLTGPEDESSFSFIDWEGWEQRLGKGIKFSEFFPVEWKWEGKTSRLTGTDAVLLIDTDGRSIQKRNERLEYMPSIGRLIQCHSFDSTGTKVCCFRVDDQSGGRSTTYSLVEFQNPRAARRRTLVPRCEDADFFASPDRKMVAVRTADQIFIVDSAGNVVGQTAVEK